MKFNLKQEFPILIIALLPLIYLVIIWTELPEKVPIHYNAKGEIDGWGSKIELAIFSILMPVFTYLLLLVIPNIDPKKKIEMMGKKFTQIKLLVVLFISVLSLVIVYSAKNQSFMLPNFVYILIGLLFSVLGNFFKTIKPNYFIGIRTPWTLENETVWKETHILGGKLWFGGGLLIILLSVLTKPNLNLILILIITSIITIIPVLFSYIRFNRIQKEIKNS